MFWRDNIFLGTILINGIMLKIIDTAGIRKTDDFVENIGVLKSLKHAHAVRKIIKY